MEATCPIPRVEDINPQANGPDIAANLPTMLYTAKYSDTVCDSDIDITKGLSDTYNPAIKTPLKTPTTHHSSLGRSITGSKAAKRRKSFCARSKGWTGERGKAARRRWKC